MSDFADHYIEVAKNEPSGSCRSTQELVHASSEWEKLRQEILRKALQLTASGVTFDFREMLCDADNAARAGQLLWHLIKPYEVRLLIGPGFGAAPLLFSTALAALKDDVHLHIQMVRDKRKAHNKKKWVEGSRHPVGTRAVIIDDFIEGGSAVSLIEKALQEDGHDINIVAMAVFFDMWQPLGSRQISLQKFPLVSLFKRHDIGLSRDAFDAVAPSMRGSYPEFIDQPLWWRFELNQTKTYRYKSAPVIAGDAVFCADDSSRVRRFRLRDGLQEWECQSLERPQKGIVQLLQYVEDGLIFGCYDGTVTKLDAASGKILWRWRQGSSIHATPAIDCDQRRLFINTEQWNEGAPYGHLQALDLDSGRQIWSTAHPYWPPSSPVYDSHFNCVVSTCNDESVICVDANTGESLWSAKTKGLVRGKPSVAEGCVLMATENGMVHCFDLKDGSLQWEKKYGKPGAHQFLETGEGCVYILDGKWHFIAMDIGSGEVRWLTRLRSAGAWGPVRMKHYLIVASTKGEIAVLDTLKKCKVWEGHAGGHVCQPPAVSDGLLALATNDVGLKVFAIHDFYQQ